MYCYKESNANQQLQALKVPGDRHCAYNVTLRHIRVTTVVEKQ